MIHAVVNPEGASGRTGRIFSRLEPVLEACGRPYTVHRSGRDIGIGQICRQVAKNADSEDILIIFGGDGTLNEAVNGIENLDRIRVGFVPSGSGNDFARGIGLEKNRERLLREILAEKELRLLDVGEVVFHDRQDMRRRFNVSSGMGFDAAICQAAAASPFKKVLNRLHLGKMIYGFCSIRLIFSLKKPRLEMTLDKKSAVSDPCLYACVMNTPYEGGGFMFGPGADDTDGIFEVCTGTARHNIVFFAIMPFAYMGKHDCFPQVKLYRASEIRFRSDTPLWVHTDGEVPCRSKDITVRFIPQKLRLLV